MYISGIACCCVAHALTKAAEETSQRVSFSILKKVCLLEKLRLLEIDRLVLNHGHHLFGPAFFIGAQEIVFLTVKDRFEYRYKTIYGKLSFNLS